jgi:hypothetical protein
MVDNWAQGIKKISLQGAYILVPLAAISLFLFNWRVSLSLLLGGLFAVLNFIGVVWGVQNVMAIESGRSKMLFMTFFRLMILFCILLILLIFKVIDIAAIAFGLSVVFILILLEGFRRARQPSDA